MSMCLSSNKGDSHICSVCGKETYHERVLKYKNHIDIEIVVAHGGIRRCHYNLRVCDIKCASKIDWKEVETRVREWEAYFKHGEVIV